MRGQARKWGQVPEEGTGEGLPRSSGDPFSESNNIMTNSERSCSFRRRKLGVDGRGVDVGFGQFFHRT